MKIDKKLLSIPPYIVTTWDNVVALTQEESQIMILLANGTSK